MNEVPLEQLPNWVLGLSTIVATGECTAALVLRRQSADCAPIGSISAWMLRDALLSTLLFAGWVAVVPNRRANALAPLLLTALWFVGWVVWSITLQLEDYPCERQTSLAAVLASPTFMFLLVVLALARLVLALQVTLKLRSDLRTAPGHRLCATWSLLARSSEIEVKV